MKRIYFVHYKVDGSDPETEEIELSPEEKASQYTFQSKIRESLAYHRRLNRVTIYSWSLIEVSK